MIISMILAMDENQGIGRGNMLPWHLPEDLKRFKNITMGHHLIMGRITFQSIGKPLSGRVNIIVTRNPNFKADGCLVTQSLEEALGTAQAKGETEVFIIGGGEIYTQAISLTDRIYLTLVHTVSKADVFFHELDETDWIIIFSQYHPPDENNQYPTTFKILEKPRGSK